MQDDADRPPLSEPIIVPDVFSTGADLEITRHYVRIVHWVEFPADEGVQPVERRIVARIVVPTHVAREIFGRRKRSPPKGSH